MAFRLTKEPTSPSELDLTKTFRELKLRASFGERGMELDALARSKVGLYFRELVPPKNVAEIGSLREPGCVSNLPDTLEWITHTLVRNRQALWQYFDQERQLLRSAMGGLGSSPILGRQKLAGLPANLWEASLQFFLAEHASGIAANKDLLWKHLDQIDTGDSEILLRLLSTRNETSGSLNVFQADLFDMAQELERTSYKPFGDFLRVFLLPWQKPHVKQLAGFLETCLRLPVADQFHALLLAARTMVSNPEIDNTSLRVLLQCLDHLGSYIADSRIRILRHATGASDLRYRSDAASAFSVSLDLYTLGAYEQAARSAEIAIRDQPNEIGAYEIFVEATLHAGIGPRLIPSAGSFSNEVVKALTVLWERSGSHAQRLDGLLRLSKLCPDQSLSASLFSLAYAEARRFFQRAHAFPVELCQINVTPRLRRSIATPKRRKEFLEFLRSRAPESPAVKLALWINDAKVVQQSPLERKTGREQYFRACRDEAAGRFATAFKLYQRYAVGRRGVNHLDQCSGLRGAFRCACVSGKQAEALEVLFAAYSLNPEFIWVFDLDLLLSKLLYASTEELKKDIRIPILAAFHRSSARELYVAMVTFLTARGVDRPSRLTATQLKTDSRLLACFFERVCTIDILMRHLAFECFDELERERLKLCQAAMDLDPSRSAALNIEIQSLQRKAILRRSIQAFTEGKIVIDAEEFLAEEDDKLRHLFERYKSFGRGGRKTENPTRPTSVFTVDDRMAAFKYFCVAVRHEFLFNSVHGLDAHLGLYVRHGTFVNHIWGVFEKHRLVNDRDGDDFLENRFWETRLGLPRYQWTLINGTLEAMSRTVYTEIIRVKNKLVQACTDSDHKEELFRYEWSEEDIVRLESQMRAMSYEDVCEALIKALTLQTEAILKDVQVYMRQRLGSFLQQTVEQAEAEVAEVKCQSPYMGELMQSFTTVKLDLQHEIDQIARWFAFPRPETVSAFRWREAIETAMELTVSRHPAFGFQARCTNVSDATIRGEHFLPVVELFLILFENIVQHSGLRGTRANVHVQVSVDSGMSCIECSSAVGSLMSTQVCANIRAKLREAHDQQQSIRGDGGTGYRKMLKILRYDFGDKNASVSAVPVATDRVKVSIRFCDIDFLA